MTFIIYGRPITKKNSQRIVTVGGHPKIIPSRQYREYEEKALWQLRVSKRVLQELQTPIVGPVNVACVYYMPTRHKVDLLNLMEATMDILVRAGILEDDNSRVVASHDGCAVLYDKQQPRVEISITGKVE